MLYDVTALLFVRISRLQVICLQSNQTLHSGQWTVGPRQYLKLLTSALWILIRVLSLNCFRRNFVFVAQWNFGNIIVSSQCPAELDIDHCWPNIAPSAAEAEAVVRWHSGGEEAGLATAGDMWSEKYLAELKRTLMLRKLKLSMKFCGRFHNIRRND